MSKKIMGVLLVALISLSGCSWNEKKETISYLEDASISFVYHENTTEHAIAFQVENKGDKKISAFMIAIISYDESGNILLATSPVRSVEVPSADLEVGESKLYRMSDNKIETSKYFRTVISKITYSDALEKNFDYLDDWTRQQGSTINVAEENKRISSILSTKALDAQKQQPLEIIGAQQKTISESYPNLGISLKIKNLKDEKVTSLKLVVLSFDGEENPTTNNEGAQFYVKNGKLLPYEGTIAGQSESGQLNAEQFFTENTAAFKLIVLEVIYENGTIWRNQNAVAWVLDNSSLFTVLE